ncbi:MAG: hypothetical protein ACOYBX_01555 [Mycobacterium sp.]
MIIWVIAGLLGLATGLRVGWALVNHQSLVSSAMIVALGSLAVVAGLNWPPLTLLVDSALHWPNISIALSEMALVGSAAGSCVMITSVASQRSAKVNRRLAFIQYAVAFTIAVITLGLFLVEPRQPEVTPREFLVSNLGAHTALPWLVPLLYVLLVLTLVSWVGMRLSNPTRRGRALFVFTVGLALLLAAIAFFLIRAVGSPDLLSVGTAAALLVCAMAVVAAGSLLPSIEDWIGARRELRLIEPLQRELERRHPDIGIGVRPRGPLVFRVAERLSLISDSLYLEAMEAEPSPEARAEPDPPDGVSAAEQALAVARWVWKGRDELSADFPGRGWLSQPSTCSDREWILEIARQYRDLQQSGGPADARRIAGTTADRPAG